MDVFSFSAGVSFVDDTVDRASLFREYWCGTPLVAPSVIVYDECELLLITKLLATKDTLIWWKYNTQR